jgi:hypothetical protein
VNGQPHALVGLLRRGGEKDYYCLESNTRPTNSSVTVVTVRSLILMGVYFCCGAKYGIIILSCFLPRPVSYFVVLT